MNKKRSAFIFSLLIVFLGNISAQHKRYGQEFFSASDAVNWIYIIKDKALKPNQVFKMDKGVLEITGLSSGYLRTQRVYSNYEINLEWRWTEKLGNSGVLLHIQPKDSIWPVCYQVQQKSNAAGDVICMNGLWAKECTDSVKMTISKQRSSNEKPLGEWNTMRVICRGNTLEVFVNGELQNSVSHLTAHSGFVGFQDEGTPMEIRNLAIKAIRRKK